MTTKAHRRGSFLALLVASVLIISGCAGKVDASEVVGTWVHSGPRGTDAELKLSSNGDVSGRDIPRVVLFGGRRIDWTRIYAFNGTWELRNGDKVWVNIDQTIDGDVVSDSGSITYLTARGDGDSIVLSTPIGDPDNGDFFVFKKR